MAPQSAHRRPSNADPQDEPATPSARRVRVDSSPGADNPFRQLRNDAGARAHPDSNRDVWEISLWDPTPLALHLFAMFSPVHVAIYWLSLPILASPDTHTSPAAVYFTVILTQALLTAQLLWVKVAFVQQAKDQRYVNKEVMHEYDTKYVQPRLNTRRRDVGVQVDAAAGSAVQIFTPHMSREGWRTNPNPNYADLTGDVPRSARPAYGTPAIAPSGAPRLSAYVLPRTVPPRFSGVDILLGLSPRLFCLLQSTSPSVPMRRATSGSGSTLARELYARSRTARPRSLPVLTPSGAAKSSSAFVDSKLCK